MAIVIGALLDSIAESIVIGLSLLGYTIFQDFFVRFHCRNDRRGGSHAGHAGRTMILEAFAVTHNFAGLITALGLLVAFVLSKPGG